MARPTRHRPIATERAPKPVGPYSQAVVFDRLVFCSGQLGFDPSSGELAEGVEAQTRHALQNIARVLEAANSGLEHIVKATVFVTDMRDFPIVNRVYGECLGDNRPARSTVQVAALPLGALVEIEVIAYVPQPGG